MFLSHQLLAYIICLQSDVVQQAYTEISSSFGWCQLLVSVIAAVRMSRISEGPLLATQTNFRKILKNCRVMIYY